MGASKDKKSVQLGMNPSTASGRLVKDLLFSFIEKSGCACYRCGEPLTRDTFSIEHKEPWLDSDNPSENYFDLGNISYSHLSCNISAARVTNKVYLTDEDRRLANNRIEKNRWGKLNPEEKKQLRVRKYAKYKC